jgi:GTPase SAR1 family protein
MADLKKAKKCPPIIIFGPPGCGKTTMLHLFMRFFEAEHVEDGVDFDTTPPFKVTGNPMQDMANLQAHKDMSAKLADQLAELQPDTLYITSANFSDGSRMAAAAVYGIMVINFWTAVEDLGEADGRPAMELYAHRYAKLVADQQLSALKKQ